MSGALSGVRVLDFTHLLAGPYSTMILADLGADVIKVEPPPTGDQSRTVGPYIDSEALFFISINRGKRSITVNLKTEEGLSLVRRLIEKADIIVENFRPGTMDRLGLGYEAVKDINHRIIYGSISGFGQTGSYRERPAVDMIIQAMGGMMSVTGEPGRGPVRPGASLGDIISGLHMAIALLAALRERDQSGTGQAIDISMLDCQVAVLENHYARYIANGEIPQPMGSRHPLASPAQAFPTKDGYIAITLRSWGVENQWALFCTAISRLDLIDDERFQTSETRLRHHDELEPILEEAFKKQTTGHWMEELSAAGVACGPVNTIADAVQMPVLKERDMLADVSHDQVGQVTIVGSPFKLSRTPGAPRGFSPLLGEDSYEVLRELLNLSDEDFARLERDGALWHSPESGD